MDKILTKIATYPVIPVYYNDDPVVCVEVLKACYEGGVRVFEFVDRGGRAEENFRDYWITKGNTCLICR